MPRRKQPTHMYSVSVSFYADEQTRERVERGEKPIIRITTELVYNGTSESRAMASLYRTARAATQNPLGYAVLMEKDGKVIIRAILSHH